ncbi:MAG TPA: glycine hydroxymethyltransferase, partial [Actinomycetota bacterium]
MNPDSTLASYLRTVCPDADLSGVSSEAVAFAAALDVVGEVAPEIASAVAAELADQRANLKLIASENFASPATLLAMGNWLSDKYAEGSPGHRFYAGCENVDTIERRGVELAKGLFGSDHAYVQPHSGIDANLVAFWSILTKRVEGPALERLGAKDLQSLPDADWESLRHELGNQRLLGMALDAGGHLTHGFRPNVSGKLFEIARYTVDPTTGLLDYDQVRKQAESFRPLILLAGYSSYPRKINF